MNASALQMNLYELDGIPVSDSLLETPVYQCIDKLRDILLERIFKKDIKYNRIFLENHSSYNTYGITDSIRKYFDDRNFWKVDYLSLSDECDIYDWNLCSGFTYDITEFAMICTVSCFSGEEIMTLTKNTFSSYLPEIYEIYFAEDQYLDQLEDDCIKLIKEMQSCAFVTDWESVHDPGLILLKNFSENIFLGWLTPVDVFENIQAIAEFCFGGLDGINRTLYIFANQYINVILQNEKYFLENANFKELKKLLVFLENPIYNDDYEFEPIVIVNEKYYSIIVLETDSSNICNVRPFLSQMLDRIDELTSLLIPMLPTEQLQIPSN